MLRTQVPQSFWLGLWPPWSFWKSERIKGENREMGYWDGDQWGNDWKAGRVEGGLVWGKKKSSHGVHRDKEGKTEKRNTCTHRGSSTLFKAGSVWVEQHLWNIKTFELKLTFSFLCKSKTLFYKKEEYPRCKKRYYTSVTGDATLHIFVFNNKKLEISKQPYNKCVCSAAVLISSGLDE